MALYVKIFFIYFCPEGVYKIKHVYLIVSVFVIGIVVWFGWGNREKIISDTTNLALYASFVGTLLGGLIGGLGSYYGGVLSGDLATKKRNFNRKGHSLSKFFFHTRCFLNFKAVVMLRRLLL